MPDMSLTPVTTDMVSSSPIPCRTHEAQCDTQSMENRPGACLGACLGYKHTHFCCWNIDSPQQSAVQNFSCLATFYKAVVSDQPLPRWADRTLTCAEDACTLRVAVRPPASCRRSLTPWGRLGLSPVKRAISSTALPRVTYFCWLPRSGAWSLKWYSCSIGPQAV